MLVTERITINGQEYLHNYSDAGYMVERDGVMYSDAIDPINSGRVYTETDTPIEPAEDIDAEYAEAGRILMGVNE